MKVENEKRFSAFSGRVAVCVKRLRSNLNYQYTTLRPCSTRRKKLGRGGGYLKNIEGVSVQRLVAGGAKKFLGGVILLDVGGLPKK